VTTNKLYAELDRRQARIQELEGALTELAEFSQRVMDETGITEQSTGWYYHLTAALEAARAALKESKTRGKA
jgi:hypothetical protein